MVWKIELTETAAKQLGKLDKSQAKRIREFLRDLAKLKDSRSKGKALMGPRLGDFWRYRIGDYRIICDIQDTRLCVLVIEIGIRGNVYR
ncbi:MAG: type II toxin-antitoxin system RelE/ParE family toxin [Nitrosospira sp.]|nr:type II toxin-antitoxin system RelE/ParE family toxin [Nitrosospira sp.]